MTDDSEQRGLIFILSWNSMAMSTPCLIRLAPTDHDDLTIPECRLAVHEPLIARRGSAAHHADRLELVDDLGDTHEGRHGAEGQATEGDLASGEDHAYAVVGEPVRQVDDAIVEELALVHGDDFRAALPPPGNLFGGIDPLGFDRDPVVRGDGEEPG